MHPVTALALYLFRAMTTFDGLREAIGRAQRHTPARIPLLNLAWNRLARLLGRLDRLTRRWESGTLPTPRIRARRTTARRAAPAERLPEGHGWLVKLLAPAGNVGAGLANVMLQDPDARALFEAAPQAGRLFRPLCRMLGLDQPEWLRLPKRPRAPRKPKPRKPRAPREDLSDLRPIAIRFIPPKDRRRLRRLGLRFKTEP